MEWKRVETILYLFILQNLLTRPKDSNINKWLLQSLNYNNMNSTLKVE